MATWTELSPPHNTGGRYGYGMCFDATNSETVLFGGNTPLLNDTWTWDGTDWTQEAPGTVPTVRQFMRLVYDPGNGNVVMFGGIGTANVQNFETWIWNGTTWAQQTPVHHPSKRSLYAMAYDYSRGNVVFFGGEDRAIADKNDTWTWDGTDWTVKSPSTVPPAVNSAMMCWDGNTNTVLMFGGKPTGAPLSNTYSWDGTDWTLLSPSTTPPARYNQAMGWDSTRSKVVMFGGAGVSVAALEDTWEWDGTDWTDVSPVAPCVAPSTRIHMQVVYDANLGKMLLYGGDHGGTPQSDTWQWPDPCGDVFVQVMRWH